MKKSTLETKVSELVEMFGTPKQIWEQIENDVARWNIKHEKNTERPSRDTIAKRVGKLKAISAMIEYLQGILEIGDL